MSVVNTWKAFIKAQEVFINQFAEPFTISFRKTDKDELLHFDIEEKNPLNSVGQIIRQAFPEINEDDININAGYLLYDSTLSPKINEEILAEAEANYLDFDQTPCFTGFIKEKSDAFRWLKEDIGLQEISQGECFATLSQINKIDEVIQGKANFSRLPTIGGIFKVKPKHPYYLKFSINEEAFNEFLSTRLKRKIYFLSEDINESEKGILLPNPQNNCFQFRFDRSLSHSEFKFKVFLLKRAIGRIFKNGDYNVTKIDEVTFFDHVSNTLNSEKYSISSEVGTIAFDFVTEEELESHLEFFKSLDFLDIDDFADQHRFKIRIKYDSPLNAIERKLQEIPSIKTKFDNDNQKLAFFCSFDDIGIINQLRARITDSINAFSYHDIDFSFDDLGRGKLKYYINFRGEEFDFEINNKFNYLKGEEISIWHLKRPVPFGTVVKLNYPKLLVKLSDALPEALGSGDPIDVCCTLKGERDKIKRLSDTLDTIFSPSSNAIPNKNLKEILIEASKAKSFPGDILLTQEYKDVLNGIESSLLSSFINDRQKEAIAKCLLAEDFFVIQGPPGTGKSTAIAELIWQHIRSHYSQNDSPYKVLVTSETNLAVDNALDKLRSKNHLLIKPIRFGSEEKLEKEGRRFSLEAIKQWKTIGNTEIKNEVSEQNIVQDWISLISARSSKRTQLSDSDWADQWTSYLNKPDSAIREIFSDTYIKNANVIGATCSSIGKLNSQYRFTRFFTDYAAICHPKELESFNSSKSHHTISRLQSKSIEFDLVVQDEASKASPPELALPCLFGKKAVVIGDHRQLPPMVDTNEFIDNLTITARKSKVLKNRNEIFSLVQFIKKNKEEFSVSHFEKLFKAIDSNLRSSFNVQYRMHPAINDTVKQFYIEDGGLNCGIPENIADSDDLSHPLNRYHGVTANKSTHVIWLNTISPEIKSGTSRVNHGEIEAIDWLLSYFKKSPGYEIFISHWSEKQLEEKQIGIITFYGAQASLLSKLKLKYPEVPLRISPVDRFQGMERNIVIVSLVRSNSIAQHPNQLPDFNNPLFNEDGYPQQDSLGFAEFPNRLNVALSRAKRLLIVVGNSKHFSKHPIYKRVYDTIQNSSYGSVRDFNSNNVVR